jgi:hypothetical protein
MGLFGVLGYTGRARPVIVGMRFAEAGMLGRRNSVAEAGLRSEPVGDVTLIGDACSLGEKDGVAGDDRLGEYRDSSLVDRPGSLVSPGRAIPPWGWWYTFRVFGSYVFVVVGGAGADVAASSTCAAVRVFLLGIVKLAEEPETGLLAVCLFDRAEAEARIEVELRVPDFSSETWSQRAGIGGACSSLGLRGAKPSVVAA